jgi:hypothetical protein
MILDQPCELKFIKNEKLGMKFIEFGKIVQKITKNHKTQ